MFDDRICIQTYKIGLKTTDISLTINNMKTHKKLSNEQLKGINGGILDTRQGIEVSAISCPNPLYENTAHYANPLSPSH